MLTLGIYFTDVKAWVEKDISEGVYWNIFNSSQKKKKKQTLQATEISISVLMKG